MKSVRSAISPVDGSDARDDISLTAGLETGEFWIFFVSVFILTFFTGLEITLFGATDRGLGELAG